MPVHHLQVNEHDGMQVTWIEEQKDVPDEHTDVAMR